MPPSHVVSEVVPSEIVQADEFAKDAEVLEHRKALMLVNYRKAIREAQQPTAWEAELAHLKARMEELEKRHADLEDLKRELKDLETKIHDTPLHAVYANFECACGSRGLLAVHVKCTSCGEEDWWGRLPKK